MVLLSHHDVALKALKRLCDVFAHWKQPPAAAMLGLQDSATQVGATQVGMLEKQHQYHSRCTKCRLYVVHRVFMLYSVRQADNNLFFSCLTSLAHASLLLDMKTHHTLMLCLCKAPEQPPRPSASHQLELRSSFSLNPTATQLV